MASVRTAAASHGHVYERAYRYGIEVDSACLATGASATLDFGSVGTRVMFPLRGS